MSEEEVAVIDAEFTAGEITRGRTATSPCQIHFTKERFYLTPQGNRPQLGLGTVVFDKIANLSVNYADVVEVKLKPGGFGRRRYLGISWRTGNTGWWNKKDGINLFPTSDEGVERLRSLLPSILPSSAKAELD